MCEYFKAAVRCDVRMAAKSPMYIDLEGVQQEEARHQELVKETLRTKQLLQALEAEAVVAAKRKNDLHAEPDAPSYRPPPLLEQNMEPSKRNLGAAAIQDRLNQRLNIFRDECNRTHSSLKHTEEREKDRYMKEQEDHKLQCDRQVNAFVVSRQITTREREREKLRQQQEAEAQSRHVHPIDVLHKRIAEDLMKESYDSVVSEQEETARANVGIDRFVETEQMKSLRYSYLSPSRHLPQPF